MLIDEAVEWRARGDVCAHPARSGSAQIGDVVFTTPAIRALREHFPAAHLTYLVEPSRSRRRCAATLTSTK